MWDKLSFSHGVHPPEHKDQSSGVPIRRMPFPEEIVLPLREELLVGLLQVQQDLGVDADMARAVISGGSVDISGSIRTILGPFLKQLSIYREFVERQHKTRLASLHLSGGLAASPDWCKALTDLLDLEPDVWNPFDRIHVPSELNLERFAGQESRFAAALGAAISGLEGGA